MDQTYDAIVLGTGLKECILSGLLSVNGFKVLHMDKNDFYGGESASLNLEQLYERFRPGVTPPAHYGRTRDWYIDLVPKFIMGRGLLVDVLRHTDVSKYLDFRRVDGSFVLHDRSRAIYKVPTTGPEAMKTSLVKVTQKNRMRKFLQYIADLDKTEGPYNLATMTARDLFTAFKISDECRTFMGHAMALWLDDSYLDRPARETCDRIRTYCMSMLSFGRSPYIYPEYGLGELPQAFARLSAVWGGTYMLRMPVDEILFHPDGKVMGIRAGAERAYCRWLIMDPTYFPDLVESVGRVHRGICILEGPLTECVEQSQMKGSTQVPTSAQIIITNNITGRRSDIYVTTQGPGHRTTPQGLSKPYCLGFVSTMAEGAIDNDLAPGFEVLQRAKILETYKFTVDIMRPKAGVQDRNIFITEGYDATSHFQTTVQDVVRLYQAITGTVLDLKAPPKNPADFVAQGWAAEEDARRRAAEEKAAGEREPEPVEREPEPIDAGAGGAEGDCPPNPEVAPEAE